MGIFIKFECDKCGEYECDCSYEERKGKMYNGPFEESIHNIPTNNNMPITKGDIILIDYDESFNGTELYVREVTKDNKVIVQNTKTGQISTLLKPYLKLCSTFKN